MSDLQKAWAKNRLTSLPIQAFDEREEEGEEEETDAVPELPEHAGDDDSSSASSASSTGTVIPSPSQNLFARPQGRPGRTLQPVPWTAYFERELFLHDDAAGPGAPTYHAYLSGPVDVHDKGCCLFVAHHGAGSSGLSFAALAAEIRRRLPSAGVLALDARGHGSTTVPPPPPPPSATTAGGGDGDGDGDRGPGSDPDPDLDLRLTMLAADLAAVVALTRRAMGWPRLPPLVLVGHSMGGAVVVEVARSAAALLAPAAAPHSAADLLLGYAVLDVVEGSAVEALQHMHTYLSTRPHGFASVEAAVDWHVRSRTVRNAASARVSVPSLLVNRQQQEQKHQQKKDYDGGGSTTTVTTTTAERKGEEEERDGGSGAAGGGEGGGGGGGVGGDPRPWKWRTDLARTQPYWEDWFVGLSRKFLEARGGKLLLLAGTDRLDTELMIGQMQGKYALQVFPEAGHFIHEDMPEKTAVALVDFHRRNDRSALVLPPKVSDLLKQGKKV
ncbi:protein phosphatase methylesterase 1 [Xylariaceae sp. FL0804]|nr:protein phosphatase methylesterase 1 [Xylariaceae sp. FL0804]